MNEFPGLAWEFSHLSTTIDLMDMTITLKRRTTSKPHYLKKIKPTPIHPPTLCPPTRVATWNRV